MYHLYNIRIRNQKYSKMNNNKRTVIIRIGRLFLLHPVHNHSPSNTPPTRLVRITSYHARNHYDVVIIMFHLTRPAHGNRVSDAELFFCKRTFIVTIIITINIIISPLTVFAFATTR